MKKISLALLFVSFGAFAGQDEIFSTGFEPSFTVGGQITGLDALGANIEIFLNGTSQLTAASNGPYTSIDLIEAGQVYDVTIDNNDCTVMNGTGVMPYQAVTNADIDCPLAFTTVYDIKQGLVTGEVALQNMLVTVCKNNYGYNVQTIPNDPDYAGEDYSAIFVFDPNMDCNALQVGDRVDINPATVNVFFDEIQLQNASHAIQSTGHLPPNPVLTTVAALDQASPHPLNAVIVEVQNVTVTDVSLQDSHFFVDMSLKVNDRHHLSAPLPEIGENMTFIRGPLAWYQDLNEIRPRDASDLGRAARLVINEVDYDQAGADTAEFIEIYNPGPTVDLTNIGIHLVNGSTNASYAYEALNAASNDTLAHGEYLVLGSQSVIDQLPNGVAGITLSSTLQNGPPDGLVLVNSATEVIYDALSYEGEITTADIGFTNAVNLVEGNATSAQDTGDGSLIRSPNGQDTDDAMTDWQFSTQMTPGFSNDLNTSDGLVINELDYDQPGTDAEEFIEIYNPTASSIDLNGVDVVLVNGSNNQEYDRISLSGSLPAGQFAVIGQASILASLPQNVLAFSSNLSFQNGAPDAVAVIKGDILIDALSYEGAITAAAITGFANPVNLVEGTATAVIDSGAVSIIRFPDGNDTGDDATDFVISNNPTPGLPNNQ